MDLAAKAASERDADGQPGRIQSGGGPVDGERVMFCAHADLSNGVHLTGMFQWYRFVPAAESVENTETGEFFTVEWFAICEQCQAEFPAPRQALTQDAAWIGPSPNITRVI